MKPILFVSGNPPGPSGTGRFVAHLEKQGAILLCAPKLKEPKTHMLREGKLFSLLLEVVRYYFYRIVFIIRIKLLESKNTHNIVILHPQFLGMKRVIRFIHKSPANIFLYILDNSYFCVRSYNYLPGSNEPCLECLGGDLQPQKINDCHPFPISGDYAIDYIIELKDLVQKGRVRLMAQCQSQATLAYRQFGTEVPIVGLWANDWNEVFDKSLPPDENNKGWDVVYHGFGEEAKGANWLLKVASNCPDLTFFFPFPKSWLQNKAVKESNNCTFRYTKWESGLKEEVARARIVIVPSLWSAAIEGSLVKSLVTSKAVAIVNAEGAFSEELSEELLIKLPHNPEHAAEVLLDKIRNNWQPNQQIKQNWIKEFEKSNRTAMQAISDYINKSLGN